MQEVLEEYPESFGGSARRVLEEHRENLESIERASGKYWGTVGIVSGNIGRVLESIGRLLGKHQETQGTSAGLNALCTEHHFMTVFGCSLSALHGMVVLYQEVPLSSLPLNSRCRMCDFKMS